MSAHRLSARRVVALLLLISGVVLAGLVFLTPLPGMLLRRPAFAFLEREYGVTGTAGRLDLDIARLRIGVEDLRLAARGHSTEPFLAIDQAVVDLPWSALWSDVSIDNVSLRGMALAVTYRTDGTSNLPATGGGTGAASAAAPAVRVGRFDLRDFTLDWRDAARNFALQLPPTSIRLIAGEETGSAASGPITMDGTARIAWRGTASEISRLDGALGFDGAALDIRRLDLSASEGELTLSGRVDNLLDRPRLDFRYDAQIDLARAASWRAGTSASGDLAVAGDANFTTGGLTASASLSTAAARWNGMVVDQLDAAVTLTPTAVRLDALRLDTAGGVLTAEARVARTPEWPGRLEAAWSGLDLDRLLTSLRPAAPALPAAEAEGSLSAQWAALDPRSVTLSGENRLIDGPGASGGLRLDAAGGQWRVTVDQRFDAAAHVSGTIEGAIAPGIDFGQGGWGDTSLAGAVTVACADLERCGLLVPALRDRDAGPALLGSATASVEVGGSLGSPVLATELEAPSLTAGPLAIHDLVARIGLDREGLEIAAVRFALGENEATGDGSVRWEDGAINGSLAATVSDLSTLAPIGLAAWSPSGRGRIEVTAGGRLDRVTADATFTLDQIAVAGRDLGNVVGGARFDAADGLRIDARFPDLAGTVDASLDLAGDERAFEIRGGISGGDLARLLPPDVPASTRVTLEATATGALADPAATRAQITITELTGAVGDLDFGLAEPAAIRYDPDGLQVNGLEAVFGRSRLRVDGGLHRSGGSALHANLDGAAADLARLAAIVMDPGAPAPAVNATGDVTAGLTASGSLNAFELTGDMRIDGGSLTVGDRPPVTDLTLRAALRDGSFHLDTLRASWAGAAIEGSAELPVALVLDALAGRSVQRGRPGRVRARIGTITPAVLAGYLDPETLGRISGQASVDADLELPALGIESARGRVTLPDAAFVVSCVLFAQPGPTEIVIEEGQATIGAFTWGNETTEIRAGGSLELGGDPTANLTVDGDLDLRAAGALLPALAAAGITAAGSAQLSAVVSGPVSAPDVRGTVRITEGEVRLPEARVAVTDVNGTLLLGGDSVTARDLAGNANGGRVAISGGWTFGGSAADNGFTITGDGLALDVPRGLRSEADVVLRAGETDGGIALSGTVTLLRSAYREPITLAGGLLEALRQRRDVAAVPLDDGDPNDVRLDIRVATLDDVVVDNNYLDAELGGNLRIGGTLSAPAVTGRVTMREGGRILFGNRVYEIDVGSVDFVDPDGIVPDLTLSARTRAEAYDITLNASGGRDELATSLRSEPPLPESDIVSVLLTGRPLDQTTAPTAGARDQALGLVSTELLGQAGRRVGLDLRVGTEAQGAQGEIRFDSSLIAADLDPTSRLTVGRDLRENVRLVFSRSLRENDLAWLVDYLPTDDLELRAFFDDEAARAYEFRHALTAGAPPRAAGRAGESERRQAQVSSTSFTGDAGDAVPQLRELLSLRSGDRFEFHRWQRDRDRLQTFFFEHGFLEARIRARRDRPAGSDAVALTYEIARGPRTELTVIGYPLPDAVRRELDTIWTRAVFDTFLIDELSTRVTEYLADRGHLRAMVDVQVEAQAGEGGPTGAKQVIIRIEAGAPTDERRVVFEGVVADDEPELQWLADSPDLAARAWTNPDQLAAAVAAWYRGRGRLRAATTVGAPRYDGRTAEVPVRVAAGPLFRIGAIRIEGARARPVADVRAAARLEAGGIYTESAVAAARARIESSYRRAGYTAARVTARSTPDDAAATVAVRFDVVEGPRQVVETVVVDGAPRTDPDVVARALRVSRGSPVDPAAWNLARKRLYDTGIFRRVDIEARIPQATGADRADGTVPVEARVTLAEWPRYLFRYGLRVTDEAAALGETTGRVLRVGAAADLRRRNLFGRGLTAGVSSRANRERQAARAFLTVPTLFGQPIETNLFASRKRDITGPRDTGFVTDVTTFTAEQRVRPLDRLTLAYSANLDLNRTYDRIPDPSFPFDLRLKIMRFNGSAVAERRDDLFDATAGFYHSSNLEYGADIGRPVRFLKYLGQHFFYRRIGRIVVASAARIGLATGFASDLIPTERFFAGGGNTVRGYAQDSIGPTGLFGGTAGGNALLILNQEARFPLGWRLAGVAFLDAGNVFPSVQDIALRDLKIGAGFGLRIETPVGLVRLDYGLPFERNVDEPRGRLFVSLGQAF